MDRFAAVAESELESGGSDLHAVPIYVCSSSTAALSFNPLCRIPVHNNYTCNSVLIS